MLVDFHSLIKTAHAKRSFSFCFRHEWRSAVKKKKIYIYIYIYKKGRRRKEKSMQLPPGSYKSNSKKKLRFYLTGTPFLHYFTAMKPIPSLSMMLTSSHSNKIYLFAFVGLKTHIVYRQVRVWKSTSDPVVCRMFTLRKNCEPRTKNVCTA